MTNPRFAYLLLAIIASSTACAADATRAPDAAAPRPIDPAGRYVVTSAFVLGAHPAHAAVVLDELHAATDGPDDPSRYLIDRAIAHLPAGRIETVARALAPYLAAHLDERLAEIAPRFADGARALAGGLGRIARRFGTREQLRVDELGTAHRAVGVLAFDAVEVPIAELAATARATLAGDELTIERHALRVPYGTVLRAGLDRAVIPAVVPAATDLAGALRELVDCVRLGEEVAAWLGVGSPALYAHACAAGLTAAAAEIYERIAALDATPLALEVSGRARGFDRDGEGRLDAIEEGAWTGSFDGVPLATASFAGGLR